MNIMRSIEYFEGEFRSDFSATVGGNCTTTNLKIERKCCYYIAGKWEGGKWFYKFNVRVYF